METSETHHDDMEHGDSNNSPTTAAHNHIWNDKHSTNNSHIFLTNTNGQQSPNKKGSRHIIHCNFIPVANNSYIVCLGVLDVRTLGTWRKTKHKKSRSLKSLKKLEIFSSSPSLFERDLSLSGEQDVNHHQRKSSVQLLEDTPTNVLQFKSKRGKL